MTGLQPSVTHCSTWSSWNLSLWPLASDILVSECPRLSVTCFNDFATLFLHKIGNSPFFLCEIWGCSSCLFWCFPHEPDDIFYEVEFWLLFHSLVSFFLTLRLYPLFWKFHPQGASIKHFPCVSHLSTVSCSMVQALGYILALLAHKTQAASIASVMYTVVTPMLNLLSTVLKTKT